MGEQTVGIAQDTIEMESFVKHLLQDVQALEYMLEHEWFEDDIVRIGAEQEICLIDKKTHKPAPINLEALEHMQGWDWVVTELAKFNLEVNLTPREFTGSALRDMENETIECLAKICQKLDPLKSDIILTGILPTLRKLDLELHNLTPKPRYFALIEALNKQLTGNAFELRLMGIDELLVKHNSPLLEACNTSFQVHLQVSPKNFVHQYNLAQALAAPIIAIGANSPIVFGKRLWHETRIALFQQALDVRTTHDHMRERSPRVSFGSGWLENSLMEIYKEDIARFRVLLSTAVDEDSLQKIDEGITPRLRALLVHNSTVYRWNRPCYGISPNGKPHLRIENRVLPSGPTVLDEVANAAFWLGSMVGMGNEIDDIRKHMSWEDVRDNFGKAAKFGIDSNFTWFGDTKITATELVKELLPIARKGLVHQQVDPADIDRYLGVIEERSKRHMNGARWQLRAFTRLRKEVSDDEALTILAATMAKNQKLNMPVHEWKMPETGDLDEYMPSKLKVEAFMDTDLFTVQPDDIIDLVAELMDWRNIRYMPVEDAKSNLVGLVSSSIILHHFIQKQRTPQLKERIVKDIMVANPVTISPDATIVEAMRTMRENSIGCLPVVQGGELIGMITEMNFLRVSGRLIERLNKE